MTTGIASRAQLRDQSHDQLEVLPAGAVAPGESTSAPRKKRAGRWWWAVPVIAVLALAVAFPIRAAVGRAELRGLEGRWRASQELISDGFAQITRLRMAAGLSFVPVISAVFQEQAEDVQRALNATRAQLVLDPPLVNVRHEMAQALRQEVTDLRRDSEYWQQPDGSPEPAYLTPQSFDAQARVERALAAQLKRLALPPASPRPGPPLKAALAGLARLNQVADQPIGARLVVSTAGGLFTVDVDNSRVAPLQLVGAEPLQVLQVVPRPGFVAIRAVGRYGPDSQVDELYTVSSTFTGPVTDLGPIDALGPGERPDTFWVRRPDGTGVEFDATFRVVRGPVELPYESQLLGATTSGLVIAIRAPSGQSFSLEIVDPEHPAAPARVVGPGVPLTVCGNRLVWFENGAQAMVHLTDVVNGVDRTIDPGSGVWPDGAWACSPDNTRVAGDWFNLSNHSVDVPGVVAAAVAEREAQAGAEPGRRPLPAEHLRHRGRGGLGVEAASRDLRV